MPDAAPASKGVSQGQPARAGLGRVAARLRTGGRGRGQWLQWALLGALAVESLWLGWALLGPVEPASAPITGPQARRPLDPLLAARAFAPGGDAPVTSSADGLALVGLRRAGNPQDSTAIIADGASTQRAYRVGDTVRPGLRLASVALDHVTLQGSGGATRLVLPGGPAPSAAPALPATAPMREAAPDGANVDPRQLMAETGLKPRLRDGRLDGFTIIPRGDGRALRSAGLQSGDVLLAVNGEELTPERMAELGQMLQSGDSPGATTTLTVERDRKRHTVTLNMESQ